MLSTSSLLLLSLSLILKSELVTDSVSFVYWYCFVNLPLVTDVSFWLWRCCPIVSIITIVYMCKHIYFVCIYIYITYPVSILSLLLALQEWVSLQNLSLSSTDHSTDIIMLNCLFVIASHCHWFIDYTVYVVSISISISTHLLLV
jgi:hypothetical protein